MKRKLQNIAYLLMAAAFVASCSEKKQISEFPDWAWTDFQRPEGARKVLIRLSLLTQQPFSIVR